jgi:hypothetical protein
MMRVGAACVIRYRGVAPVRGACVTMAGVTDVTVAAAMTV